EHDGHAQMNVEILERHRLNMCSLKRVQRSQVRLHGRRTVEADPIDVCVHIHRRSLSFRFYGMSAILGAPEILDAASQCRGFLCTALTADWSVPVPDLEMTAAQVVAHAAETGLWYAIDLSARGKDLTLVEHRVKPENRPEDLV